MFVSVAVKIHVEEYVICLYIICKALLSKMF